MSFFLKPAHSSAVKKSRQKSSLLRKSSSSSSAAPFSSSRRTKPGVGGNQTTKQESKSAAKWHVFDQELEDQGLVTTLATELHLRDVPQYVLHIRDSMFDAIPERAGMNSTRVAEVLNYQRNMPPIVTRAHVHALSKSPTSTEREMAEMVRAGVLRRIEILGRGRGGQAVGDCLVLTDEWIRMVREAPSLDEELKAKYMHIVRSSKGATSIKTQTFTQLEATALTQAGFLTNPSTLNATAMLRPDSATLGSLTSLASVGSRSVSGSKAAVGGAGAIHEVGGSGSALGNVANLEAHDVSASMTLTVPSIGIFLRLLTAAREHLVHLLSRSRYHHAPLDILRERWDGQVEGASASKSAGTTAKNVSPARTRKWKQFYGLRFQWVLEECLGTGLIEVFETGSVGLGVRIAS